VDARAAVAHDPQHSPQRIEADVDGGARVLIVDDHVMLRESMRVALELAG
jgi:hypoxanthine phosphoribosyltransferase